MLRKLYRLDDAARRMRVRVLTVTFTAAFAIVVWIIIAGFIGLAVNGGMKGAADTDISTRTLVFDITGKK
jgi:hypothetical protein